MSTSTAGHGIPFDEMHETRVRLFQAKTDREAVEACLCELQEVGRAHDPRLPPGKLVAQAHVTSLETRCRQHQGAILVAERLGKIIGYACVLARCPTDEPADGLAEEARLVDLVVLEQARGCGAGKLLVAAAEAWAATRGAGCMRVAVFAWNHSAKALYDHLGYRPLEVILEKALPTAPASGAPS